MRYVDYMIYREVDYVSSRGLVNDFDYNDCNI